MRSLSLIALIIAILALIVGAYVQFSLVPEVEALEASDMNGEMAGAAWSEAYSMKTNLGIMILLAGGLGVLMTIVPMIRTKSGLSITAFFLSLAAFFLGCAHGTHMFS
jgi:hypothetical protein